MDIDSDTKEILVKGCRSSKYFAQTFFPEVFYMPFCKGHDEMFRIMDDSSIQKAVISAPRGFGKSTIFSFLAPAKAILYRDEKFIVTVEDSATQAELDTETLKDELLSNERVQEIFGPQKPRKVDPRNAFSKSQWIMYTAEGTPGTMVLPRGAGQRIRGIKFGHYRPGLIIVDDLENDENVLNEDQRSKLKKWFLGSLMGAVDKHRHRWRVMFVGTPLHEDSLLMNLMEDPTWHSVEIAICDDNYKSNWPSLYSDSDIMKMVREHEAQGELDLFYREYMGRHIASRDAVFRVEYFKFYDEDTAKLWEDRSIESVVIVDPAKTVKMHSAESAVVCVGIDRQNRRFYVRDLVAKRMYPDELYSVIFRMADTYHARAIGIEVTSLNEFIVGPINNQIRMEGKHYELVQLNPRSSKEYRVSGLASYYRQGLIYHNRLVTGPLEAQLLSFPRAKRWDCMDALAYIIEMSEIGGRYFFPQTMEEYSEEQETVDEEAEYAAVEADYGRPLTGWRIPGI